MADHWGTPFLSVHYSQEAVASMNAALRTRILHAEQTEVPLTIGTMNASKLAQDILRDEADPAVRQFTEMILHAAERLTADTIGAELAGVAAADFIAEAWAVVYRRGGNHRVHCHPGAVWSGVYYVSCPDDGDGGQLELIDPRPAALANRGQSRGLTSIQPTSGLLVGFPSWLQHNVTPLRNYDERICLAFNVGFAAAGAK